MNRNDKCVSERRANNLTKGEQIGHRVRLTWWRALLWDVSDHRVRAIQGNIHTIAYDGTTQQQSQGELTQLTSSPAEAGHHPLPLTKTPAPTEKPVRSQTLFSRRQIMRRMGRNSKATTQKPSLPPTLSQQAPSLSPATPSPPPLPRLQFPRKSLPHQNASLQQRATTTNTVPPDQNNSCDPLQ